MSDVSGRRESGTAESLPDFSLVEARPERLCVRCGYALQGLSPVGKCPECGTDAALSWREPTLAAVTPEHLASLERGLSVVLYSTPLLAAASVGATLLLEAVNASHLAFAITDLCLFAISSLLLWGHWLLSRPEPSRKATEANLDARRVVRGVVLAQLALALTLLAMSLGSRAPFGAGTPLIEWLTFSNWLLWAVQFSATMRLTRRIGGRIPDQFIVRRSKVYAWVLPFLATVGVLAAFLGPLIALILYWDLLERLRNHVRSIRATGRPAASLPMEG